MLITIPYFMKKLIPLSTILGVKNLMPNPRLGHITDNPIYIINEIINKGRIEYKMDKFGIINCSIARSNYNYKKIKCNMIYFLKKLLNNNNLNNNINIIKNIFISSTYSPSIKIKKI
ncbi:MAG: hypothetical protein ABUS76_00500 [Candidatus Shikimatogenerans sp. Ttur]|uniref:Large ribosomal subunit protein uL1 n=1 Tax=Candidatus Shikimatogenerans sp. Ttur TaxID=3158569 RepID=A0AAU7ZY37_9FLAO